MLEQNKFKKNDVVTLKLVSGEEIIGYFVHDTSSQITLRKPLVPVPMNDGQVGLAPFLMSSNYLHEGGGEVQFNKTSVTTTMSAGKEFSDAYTQQVSGVQMGNQGLIT